MPLDLGIFDNKKQSWFTGESSVYKGVQRNVFQIT